MDTILAINCGSSSLKWALFDGRASPRRLDGGIVERIRPGGHGEAAAGVLQALDAERLDVVGHRVVHGGRRFIGPVVVDDEVEAAIGELSPLAPLHNPPALAALHAVRERTAAPSVATFDTAFHARMPEAAATYAIDPELANRHAIRRYGFHGLAHASMVDRYAAHAGHPATALRLVTLQLGNGCSAAAVDGGRSVETTMGLTPAEGLVMGTRSGDVDPALIGFLARAEGLTLEQVEDRLVRRSGLLGVSGHSADMRDLLAAAAAGDSRAAFAIDLFCHRTVKAIGALLAVLGGADALVFGGGIGQKAKLVREQICAPLAWAGVALDGERNAALRGEGTVSSQESPVEVFVARVDEEARIAADTVIAARGVPTGA